MRCVVTGKRGGLRRAGAWPAAPPGPVRAGLDRFWEQSGLAGNIFKKIGFRCVIFEKIFPKLGQNRIFCVILADTDVT